MAKKGFMICDTDTILACWEIFVFPLLSICDPSQEWQNIENIVLRLTERSGY